MSTFPNFVHYEKPRRLRRSRRFRRQIDAQLDASTSGPASGGRVLRIVTSNSGRSTNTLTAFIAGSGLGWTRIFASSELELHGRLESLGIES